MHRFFYVCAISLALCGAAVASDKPQTPAQLRAAADAATGEQCTRICVEAAHALVEEANGFYTAGDVDKGLADMKDAVGYAQKASQETIRSRKKQKQTEIALRKLERRILDVKDTLNFEDRPVVQELADRVDKFRAQILAAMFDLQPPPPPPKENK